MLYSEKRNELEGKTVWNECGMFGEGAGKVNLNSRYFLAEDFFLATELRRLRVRFAIGQFQSKIDSELFSNTLCHRKGN